MKVKLINTGNIYGYPLALYSGFPLSGAHFGVFAMTSDHTPSEHASKDVIVSGERTDWGDRSCDHWKMNGDLFGVPSSLVTRKLVNCETGPYWAPASTPQVRYDYVIKGVTWRMIGPVAYDSVPSYRQDFPDMISDRIYKRTEIYVEINSTGTVFDRIVHFRTTNLQTGYTDVCHEVMTIEVDFPRRRYREMNAPAYWYGLPVVATASFVDDASWLPRSARDYKHLYQILRSRFDLSGLTLALGDLVRRCANDAQIVQTNSIELIRDVREFSDSIREAYALTKGKISAKKIAQGYLSYKYGARLTVQDLQLIADTVNGQLRQQYLAYRKVHASNVVSYVPLVMDVCKSLDMKITYTIHYRPYSQDWRRATQLMWDAGLFPSLQNSWDLVPLSFVVDWFSQLGDRLSEIDAETYWSLHDILGSCHSQKMVFSDVSSLFHTPGITLLGSCDLQYYCRAPHSRVLQPSYFVNSPREFRNYAEATALIVANKRR